MIPSALTLLPPARPLREPTWWATPGYVYTLGPEVATICALAGYAPDPEQQLLLDGTFGVAENGKAAAFEIDAIAARRALKTGFVVQCILGWAFVTHERKVMYTAHDLDAARETWDTVATLIESTPALAAQLQPTRGDRPGIVEGNGRWAIVLRAIPERGIPKRRIIFKTRGKSTGRALSGNKLIIDEAFAATQRQVGSVLPILGAEDDPQVIFASSAGMVESEVLIDSRDRGRAGGTSRQLYAEWGDKHAGEGCELGEGCDHAKTAPGCALDDEDRWAQIIPELGGRVKVETIRALRQTMPPLEFAREFMVWWDVEGAGTPPAIAAADWEQRRWLKARPPKRAVIFLDVAPDRRSGCVGVAGPSRKGRTLVIVQHQPGTAWMVPAVEKLLAKRDIVEVALFPGSQASSLVTALINAEIEFETLTRAEMGQACAEFIEGSKADGDHHIEHVGQQALKDGIANAITRYIGEIEMWDRRDFNGADISPVVAASGAAHRWGIHAASEYDATESVY